MSHFSLFNTAFYAFSVQKNKKMFNVSPKSVKLMFFLSKKLGKRAQNWSTIRKFCFSYFFCLNYERKKSKISLELIQFRFIWFKNDVRNIYHILDQVGVGIFRPTQFEPFQDQSWTIYFYMGRCALPVEKMLFAYSDPILINFG